MKKINNLKIRVIKSKGFIFVFSFALFLFCTSVIGVGSIQGSDKKEVLGESSVSKITREVKVSPTPSISITPTIAPRISQVIQKQNVSPTLTPTAAPASVNNSSSNNSSSPTPTMTPSLTPVPSIVNDTVKIFVDYGGKKTSDSYEVAIEPGQKAWDAVIKALGLENIEYTDYGGDMGKFITSFNGIKADSNQYFEFRVNGVSSSLGVSSYVCNNADKLEFVLVNF